jgi:hypothetical protein
MTASNEAPDAVWIDTCVLVYANLALSPFHQLAVERLQLYDEIGCDLWISRQTLREYLSAMTKQNALTAIVATMSDYGVERLLTHNVKDFTRFSNIITILPLEAVN